MTRVVRVRPRADRDIDEAADYYANHASPSVALRFLAAVEQTWSALAEQPHIGASHSWWSVRLKGCRRWRVAKPFEVHQVFYLSTADAYIDIIRVLHGVRDLERLFDDEDAGGSET